MNEVVSINDTEIGVKEYKGQRVVTFKDIDAVHGRPDGTAKRNFASNRERFIEGEDYFVVKAENLENTEKYEKRTTGIEVTSPRGIALITEQGYLMLVKSFTDDLAWDVQRKLVNSYFKAKTSHAELSPQMQMLYGMLDQMAQTERKANEAKELANKAIEATESIREAIQPVSADVWREDVNKKFNRIQHNSTVPFNVLRTEMYAELERRAGCDLAVRLRNKKERMADMGCRKTDINATNRMDVIDADKRLREIFAKIVTEYEVKYCTR